MNQPAYQIEHLGRIVQLNGPGSQDLTLQGSDPTAGQGRVILAYEPENKEASELEIRARITGTDLPLGLLPVIRWSDELGHGDLTWREPHPALPIVAGTSMLAFSLPARGMVWRTNARQFRIGFQNAGTQPPGGPLTKTTVNVSVLPVTSGHVNVYPYTYMAQPGTVQQPLPMTAREFRLHDFLGQPLALGAVSIIFTGIMGTLLGPIDGALFGDFRPIPHDAVSFTPGALCYAEYR